MSERPRDEAGRYESAFTPELGDQICSEMVDGKSLRSICAMEGMPSKRTVMFWLRTRPEFKEAYRTAQQERAECWIEEIIEIADDNSRDFITDEEGKTRPDHDHIARSRLKVDTRKWIAAKMMPKLYGEKLAVGGADDLPPVSVQKIERVIVRPPKSSS